MNRVYRLVWNRALRLLQVSSELTRAPRSQTTGGGGGTVRRNGLALACRLALGTVLMSALWAAPPLAAQSLDHATGGTGGGTSVSYADGGKGGDAGQRGEDGADGIGGLPGSTPGASGEDGIGAGGGGGGAHGGELTGDDPVQDMIGGKGGDNTDGYDGHVAEQASGGGGAGGDGALIRQSVAASINEGINLRGGNGGFSRTHPDATRGDGNGGGGGGGAGLYVEGPGVTATLQVAGLIAGGDGGEGRETSGGGGAGVVATDGATLAIDLTGRIVGGSGGDGADGGDGIVASADSRVDVVLGQDAEIVGGFGPGVAQGGAGLRLAGGGTVTNHGGTISGGAVDNASSGRRNVHSEGGKGSGGAAGGTGEPRHSEAGVGIIGQNLTIINAGTITGGLHPSTGPANAITFTGGSNLLMMHEGSVIEGVVDATASDADMLAIGGSQVGGTFEFDVGQIGPDAQYRGFEQYWASDSGMGSTVVKLTGTTTEITPWTSDNGAVLSVATDASLGDDSGALLLRYGGNVQFTGTGDETVARRVDIYQSGGIDVADAGKHITLTGGVVDYDLTPGGPGLTPSGLLKLGAGTLTLSGTNTYSGGTFVANGTLEIAAGSSAGSVGSNAGVSGMSGGMIQLAGGTTINNAGTVGAVRVDGTGLMPPEVAFAPVTVTNSGSIIGDNAGVGVSLLNGQVNNSGNISVTDTPAMAGVMLVGAGGIDNAGSIRAEHGTGALLGALASTSVPITDPITLSNHDGGSVEGDIGILTSQMVVLVEGTSPVYSSRPIIITNDGGSIRGDAMGIELFAGGTVVNQAGSLIATTAVTGGDPCGAQLPGQSPGGNSGCAIYAPDLADMAGSMPPGVTIPATFLTNAGSIVGNVQLSDELANEVTLVAGGSIDGSLDIGSSTDAKLTLQGDAGTSQTYSQAVTGDTTFAGQLTKSGAGTWVLDNAALAGVTGTTQLQAGSLIVGGAEGDGGVLGGNVAVAGGATLGGHGTVDGNVAVAAGGAISPGNSIGQLSIGGDLDMAQGSMLDIELGAPPATAGTFGAGDHIAVGGDLALRGVTLNVSDAGNMGPGLYNLFTWQGALSTSNGGIVQGSVPAGSVFTIQTLLGSKQINLIQSGGVVLNVWNANGLADATRMGGGSGTWSTTSSTWTDIDASVPNGPMTPQPGFALFGGDPGVVTVDNGDGDVSATGMQFAVDGYTLAGDQLSLVQDGDGNAPIIRVGDGGAAGAGMSATIDAELAGSDGLVKADQGTLVLTGDNSYTGGTTITSGTLQLGNGSSTGSILGDVANNGTLAFDRSDDVAFAGVVSGSGSLAQQGSGTLELTGDNSYTGGTTIASGTLQIGNGGSSGSILGDVANDGTLAFERSDDVAFAGVVSGSGSLAQQGSGTLVLTGDNSYTGGTTITSGSLQLGNGGSTGSILGNVVNNGGLVFDRSDDVAFAGVVSGSGSLAQQGSGTLVLTGDNSYTGGTTIAAGTLQLGNGGSTGSILGDVANDGTLAFDRSDDVSFGGVVSGSGSLAQLGSGTLTLTGDNSYAGGTTITSGSLQLGNGGSTGSILGDVANDGTLAFDRSDEMSFAGVVSGSGSLVQQGSGTLVLTGDNSYAGGTTIAAGSLQIGNGGSTGSILGDVANDGTLAFDRSDDLTFDGVISGSGIVLQQGSGVLTLEGDSHAFTGGTEVHSGELDVGSGAGSAAVLGGNVQVDTAATLAGHGRIGGDVELRSGAHLNAGSATAAIGSLEIGGNLVLAAGSVVDVDLGTPLANFQPFGASDNIAVGGDLTLAGTTLDVDDAGGMGPGLYNVIRWDGGLNGDAGDIALGHVPAGSSLLLQVLSAQKQINLIDTEGLTLDVWNANGKADATRMGGGDGRWSTTSPMWTDAEGTTPNGAMQPQPGFALFGGDAGTVTVDGGAGDVSATGMQFAVDGYTLTGDVLTLVKNADGDVPIIRVGDGSAAGASMAAVIDAVLAGTDGLVKADQGTLMLAGANTFSGGVTVSGGALAVADDVNLGDASNALTLDGGMLEITGTAFTSTVRDIVLGDHGGGFAIDEADAGFTVASSLDGKGRLIKRGAGSLLLTGTNSYAGGTTIASGTLQLGNGGTTGSITGDVANDGTLVFDRSDAVVFDGTVSGTGALVQQGKGALVLTGANSYTGGTTIASGTLQLGNGGTTGSISGDVANDGRLVFDRSDAVVFGGKVSGTGALVQQGKGTLVLTGANSHTGGTTIASGTLQLGNGGTTGSISGDVANAGRLVFDRSDELVFGGKVSGNGALVQQGKGTLVLTGANSHTGGTTIASGTLQLGNGGTTGSISGDVANAGTLVFDRSDAVVFGGKISGTGALVQQGEGSLTLAGTQTYAGGTTIAAGSLIGDAGSLHGAIDNHGALIFMQNSNDAFDGQLAGDGSVAKRGKGELILNGDSHAFSGVTSVEEGALIVGDDGFADAALGGVVKVGKQGVLGGFGTVGGLDLAGTLATGHSIGTLHVSGDAIFRAGSIWQIEVDPEGHGDRLDVAGKAVIKGGSALAMGSDGNWKANTDYVVLDATGGVDGQFDEVSSNLAFLKPTLAYAANSVTLSLARNQVDFGDVAHTPNQTGVAEVIDDAGPGHPAYDAIVDMDEDHARDAFDQLSGEWYAGMQSARLDDSRYVREAMNQRLVQAEAGVAGNAASLGSSAGAVWFHGWGQWGDRDGDGNAARMQSSGSGMLVGVDADIDGRARIGGVLGASQSAIRVGERVSDGRGKATWVGIYGSANTGPLQWHGGLAYASERLDSHRHLTVPGLAGDVGSDLRGRTEQGWVEAALPYALGRGRVDPFLNLAHVRVHSDRWSEGGGDAALSGSGGDAKASLATLGVRGSWNLGSAELPIRLHGSLGWRQAFGADAPEMHMSLDGSAPFTVYGLPLARHAVAVEAGLDFAVSEKVGVDFGYNGQFAGDARDQGARLTVRIGW